MSNKIKYSIGIPAYKAKFLTECIESILNQTYTNFELIIINDASPENIDEIISQYNDNRISYYKNEINIGAENVVDNWNRCLEKASGTFFILMGDDDKMETNYLECFNELIEKYPDLNVYHCRSKIINEQSEIIMLTYSWPEYESVYENIWHRIKWLRLQYISDFVYRTEALKTKGGFYKIPLAWASDDISAYIAAENKGIAHTQSPVFCYRQNAQTISNTGNVELKMQAILKEEKWLNSFLIKPPFSEQDNIIYNNIKNHSKKYIQKKKLLTISKHFNSFRIFIFWFKFRKTYKISTIELFYAIIEGIKQSLSK